MLERGGSGTRFLTLYAHSLASASAVKQDSNIYCVLLFLFGKLSVPAGMHTSAQIYLEV